MVSNYIDGICSSECVIIGSSNRTHAGMQITFGVDITILDAAMHYCTLDSYGNLTDKYVDSAISCWIEHCSLGNDPCVKRVFSNILDRRFSSTGEYLSWMHARVAN